MNIRNNQRFCDMDIKLKAAFLELMKTTAFEKITVKSICESAHVNRSTFYAHYSDIFEIMEQMEDYLNQELLESFTYDFSGIRPELDSIPTEPFIPFLTHIKKHSYFYKIALGQSRKFPLAQGYEPIWRHLIKPRCEAAGIISEAEQQYYFIYFQTGAAMVLRHWVNTECQETEEAMAVILKNCASGIWTSLL